MATDTLIRIATRGSRLAVWQAEHVRSRLCELHPEFAIELVKIKTLGDRMLATPLAKIGGKGLFIKELEQALLAGTADLAVHSMKDVPVDLPAELCIAAVLSREDPRDCLLAPKHRDFASLPVQAVIGTASLRRRSQLAARRSDLRLHELRGNVTTRINKLTNGGFDGIVLAAAGLIRLGLSTEITEYFATDQMLPAIGQGIIGIECRRDDRRILDIIGALEDPITRDALDAERALNARLQGGCQVPIAGYATIEGNRLRIEGLVASLDGMTIVRASGEGRRTDAVVIGDALADELLMTGADRILSELRSA